MGLFTKRHDTESAAPLYTFGLQKTMLIVGLGNDGKAYVGTRHNIGFAAVDALAQSQEASWVTKKDLKCNLSTFTIGSTRILAIKPTTMMNLSGEAVQAVAHFYKVAVPDIMVVHDELDVDFGSIRLRSGGGAAGHNGIKSVIEHCGEGFGRVRIGIGPKKPAQIDSADFVLAVFSTDEQAHIKTLTKEVISLLNEIIASGHITEETRKWLV
jgi:peptidyl-tRNA hydrolase, PTH1 family